ncbi:Uncharacterised protein [Mycobacterium tuberculosis]|nr:Uncharacterised protein [Mycobacterium tuberculosis]
MPMTWPVAVSGTWSAMRAMPKSVIFTRPSGVMRRFPGLMSRCTRPAACAAWRAEAVCATMSSVLSALSEPSRSRMVDRASPGTSSMTRYALPFSSP